MSLLNDLGLYLLLVTGVVLIPGMDMSLVIASSAAGGLRHGMRAVAGIMVGGVIHFALAFLGISALLLALPGAGKALLLTGALYLAWLGIQLLRSSTRAHEFSSPSRTVEGAFVRGVVTCLMNPKAYAFTLAVLPVFMRSDALAPWLQASLLSAMTALVQLTIYGGVAWATVHAGRRLNQQSTGKPWLLRASGAALVASAALTVVSAWHTPVVSASNASPDPTTPSEEASMDKHAGERDFDFLIGHWNVRHRRLKQRLRGSDSWEEFGGSAHAQPMLDGQANVDDNLLELPSGDYRALSIRSFDRASGRWAIWWLDARSPHALEKPVLGRFTNGVGTFETEDELDGRPIRVRFTWSDISPTSARWQQAFSDDAGVSWETNWVMDFERVHD